MTCLVGRDHDGDVSFLEPGGAGAHAWIAAHERRLDAALAALDNGARAAIAGALPALFQLAEHLGEPGDDDPATARAASKPSSDFAVPTRFT